MNKSKSHHNQFQVLKFGNSFFNDASLNLQLDASFPGSTEMDLVQLADVQKGKTRTKVNELGTLGTLKNLTKLLSQQDSTLNLSKSTKQAEISTQSAIAPGSTLNSHQLFVKQQALLRQAQHQQSAENMSIKPTLQQHHRPTNSSQLVSGPQKAAKARNLEKSASNIKKVLNNTLSVPISGLQADKPPTQPPKKETINKLIRDNLKRQKAKEDKAFQDQEAERMKEQQKKLDLALQNQHVRYSNMLKTMSQERKSKVSSKQRPSQIGRSKMAQITQSYDELAIVTRASQPEVLRGRSVERKEVVNEDLQQTGNNSQIAQMQRVSQERGQRVLSGASKGSKGGSAKSGGSRKYSNNLKSGRSVGQVYSGAQFVLQDQRGLARPTQPSMANKGNRDSINSSRSGMNQQQSQQVMPAQEHGEFGLQTSQRLDNSAFLGIMQSLENQSQNWGIEEHQSQEDSANYTDRKDLLLKNSKESVHWKKSSLKGLAAEVHKVPYQSPSKKIQTEEDLSELFLNRKAQTSANLRSNPNLHKGKWNANEILNLQNQTFSHKFTGKTSTNNLDCKNIRKQSGLNQHSSSGLWNINAQQQKPVTSQTIYSNGLDFLDIKKEIQDELKQVDKKLVKKKENVVEVLQSHPALQQLQTATRQRGTEKRIAMTSHGGGGSHLNLQNVFLNESSSVQQLQAEVIPFLGTIQAPQVQKKKNKNAIQKFIKAKRQEREMQIEHTKQEEQKKFMKTQLNLSKLDCYVRKKFQQSIGHLQNLSSHNLLEKQNNIQKTHNPKQSQFVKKEASIYQDLDKVKNSKVFFNGITDSMEESNLFDIDSSSQVVYIQDKQPSISKSSAEKFDLMLAEKLKELRQIRLENQSEASTQRRVLQGRGSAHSSRNRAPEEIAQNFSGKQKRSQKITMKCLNDILSRSKSQQRASDSLQQTSSLTMNYRKMQAPVNTKTVNTTKNNKLKTIDSKHTDQDVQKRSKSRKQNKQSQSQRAKQRMSKLNSYNPQRVNNHKQKSQSKSRSKSNKQRGCSKKSHSKSQDKKQARSQKSPPLNSNSRSLGSKKSKKGSSAKTKRSISISRSKDERRKQEISAKNQRNSLSPKVPELMSSSHSLPTGTATRNHLTGQLRSDFDYSKFMHGTLKISPSVAVTTLGRNLALNKSQLPPARSSGARRRNRSQARLTNATAQQATKQRPSNSMEKHKSLTNLNDGFSIDRSSSNLKNRSQNRAKVPPSSTKELPKSSKAAWRKLQVQSQQIQEILRKININFNSHKKKKRKAAKKTKVPPVVNIITTQQIQNMVSPSQGEISSNFSAAKKMFSPQPEVTNAMLAGKKQQPKQTAGGRVRDDQDQSKMNEVPQQVSDKEKQKQLKELLKSIYKKNEELIKQCVHKGSADKKQEIITPNNEYDSKKQQSPAPQSSKLARYSEEKWVEAPLEKFVGLKKHTQQISHKSASQRMSDQSNNFTFCEKTGLNYRIINQGLSYQSLHMNQKNQIPLHNLTEEIIDDIATYHCPASVPRVASSRSVRSIHSGIIAQLNELASTGGLRQDNEIYLQKMLEHTNVPPFTAMDSHRSLPISSRHFSVDHHQILKVDQAPSGNLVESSHKSLQQRSESIRYEDQRAASESVESSQFYGLDEAKKKQSSNEKQQIALEQKLENEPIQPDYAVTFDKQNLITVFNEDFENDEFEQKVEMLHEAQAPLHQVPQDSNRQSAKRLSAQESHSQLTAENLKRYLESKNVILSQHGGLAQSGVHDNSRVVSAMSGLQKHGKSNHDNKDLSDSLLLDHNSIEVMLVDHIVTSPDLITNKENDTSTNQLNQTHPQDSQEDQNVGINTTQEFNEFLHQPSKSSHLDKSGIQSQSNIQDSLCEEYTNGNELDKYLDDDISEKSPVLQEHSQPQPVEMNINSNLNTLNLESDAFNSEVSATVADNQHLDENFQQLKDKQFLDKFRQRQNRLNSKDTDQKFEIEQIEIDIQENSEPNSPTKPTIQVAFEKVTMTKKGLNDETIKTLAFKPDEKESQVVCRGLVIDLVDIFLGKVEAKKSIKDLSRKDIYTFIANSVNQNELKLQIKQIVEMKQRTAIEGDLFQTDDYINEILAYLMQFELITQHQIAGGVEDSEIKAMIEELGGINYLVIFLRNLTQPIKRNLLDYLQMYTKSQDQQQATYMHFESVQDPLKFPILPIDIYLDVEKHREYEYQLSQKQNKSKTQFVSNIRNYLSGHSASSVNTVSIIQESQHILNKSIFDAMNESLTKFRPYGITGEPLPWSNKHRRLQTEVDINSVDTERLIQMVKQEVFRWMSNQQGHLLHTHDTIFQYIDLSVPLMPDLLVKMQEKEKMKVEEATVELLQIVSKELQQPEPKIHNEEDKKLKTVDSKTKEEKTKEDKERQALQDKEPIDFKSFTQAKELAQLQETQFLKFKKNLIEEATQEMRQSKLAAQLQHEILEDEHYWLNYEFEETQIRFDLSNMIFDQLLQETIQFLQTKQEA